MNHLAHFVLSGDDEDLAIGNFVADFITNRQLPDFREGVQRGIHLHRAIDAFTDAHPVVKQSTKRLHPFHHKYSPVIVDVYYDFLLAKNWEECQATYPSVPLSFFVENAYNLLTDRVKEMPERLQMFLPRMIADDFLMTPTTFEGLNKSFERIEKATHFPSNFSKAAGHLEEFLDAFDVEFCQFFPDLQNHVTEFLKQGRP